MPLSPHRPIGRPLTRVTARQTLRQLLKGIADTMQAEKEKRIAHTQQMAVRRIGKRDLTRGWVAWSDLYLEQRRRKNMLKAAGAKLTRPKLVASYSLWRRDWETETTSKAAMSIGEKLLLAEQERERLRAELAKTAEELDNARRAMLEGRGQEAELQRQMEERLEREREKRIEHTKEMAQDPDHEHEHEHDPYEGADPTVYVWGGLAALCMGLLVC